MTDRIKGVWVCFDRDIREDDCESIVTAIRMLRGVLDVTTSIAGPEDWMAQTRIRRELTDALFDVLKERKT